MECNTAISMPSDGNKCITMLCPQTKCNLFLYLHSVVDLPLHSEDLWRSSNIQLYRGCVTLGGLLKISQLPNKMAAQNVFHRYVHGYAYFQKQCEAKFYPSWGTTLFVFTNREDFFFVNAHQCKGKRQIIFVVALVFLRPCFCINCPSCCKIVPS